MDELTNVMANSVILCFEHLKKQGVQIEQLFDLIKSQQQMMTNQEKRISILREMVENISRSREHEIEMIRKIIEKK
jgi:hypothetical protein